MIEVMVHPHALKHGVREADIRYAWENFIRQRQRSAPQSDQIVSVGVSPRGDLIQMVGVINSQGVLVYHALTPPTENVIRELGLARRK